MAFIMKAPLRGFAAADSSDAAATYTPPRVQAKRAQLKMLPESQGQDLAVAVLCVPYSRDSGGKKRWKLASSASGGLPLPAHPLRPPPRI